MDISYNYYCCYLSLPSLFSISSPSISMLRLYFAYTYRFRCAFSRKFQTISKGCTGSTLADFPSPILQHFFSPIQSFYLCCAVMSVVVNWILCSFFQFILLQMVVLFIWLVYVSCVLVGELVGNFLPTIRKSGGITDLT